VRRPRGFTLIEIVVAVAVLAFAMGAVISAMARYAQNSAYIREKTVALWVAHNKLTELEFEGAYPEIGKSDGDAEMGGVKWRWYQIVSETPDENLRRVEIRVREQGADDDVATLTSFKAKP
jgi:general secretion pathway protein I